MTNLRGQLSAQGRKDWRLRLAVRFGATCWLATESVTVSVCACRGKATQLWLGLKLTHCDTMAIFHL